MKKSRFLILTFTFLLTIGPITNAASAAKFGSGPLDDVFDAANYEAQYISDLTTNELAAIILAITWPEAAGGSTSVTPSPMTLSRGDGHSGLWSFENRSSSNSYKRAFWHPGIGLWQIDSAGFARELGAHDRINSAVAAPVVADEIAASWESSIGTDSERRNEVWQPWYACNNGACEDIFQQIYDSSNDSLNISRDYSVSSMGGMEETYCNTTYSYNTFTCYKIDPSQAEGYTGSWIYSPYEGDTSDGIPSPLTYSFWSYVQYSDEHRHWLGPDTGYNIDIRAIRDTADNARGNLLWYNSSYLCPEGNCPN